MFGYEQSATNEFMSVADYYLIAQAKQRKAIVVTHEVPSNSLKKIKTWHKISWLPIIYGEHGSN
jgi:ribosomal protein L30E